MRLYLFFIVMLCCFTLNIGWARADVTIVMQGKSTFSIVVPLNAPASLLSAAQELQKDISLSTRAKLPIVKDADHITITTERNIKGRF